MRYLRSERGVVALLSAVFISMLVMIVTLSMVVIGIREQRQATDIDQSARAYYAAQAGVEEAILDLKTALASPNPSAALAGFDGRCDGDPVEVDPAREAVVTCKRIINTVNRLTGGLQNEETLELDLSDSLFRTLEIRWNRPEEGNSVTSAITGFPPRQTWVNNRHPAVIEVTAVSYPSSSSFSIGAIDIKNYVLKPGIQSSPFTETAVSTSAPYLAPCDQAVTSVQPYRCGKALNLDSTRRYVVRIRPRYVNTSYSVRLRSSSGSIVPVPDQTLTIDVTARAGDVFRRIVSRVPRRGSVFSGLDYVLFSDTDICKTARLDSSNGSLVAGTVGPTCP